MICGGEMLRAATLSGFAEAHGVDPFIAVLAAIAVLLGAGTAAFALLPAPPRTRH